MRGSGPVYFEVGCAVLVLVTLGRWLEARGKQRATAALEAMEKLLPDVVRRYEGSETRQIALDEVNVGDRLRVQMLARDIIVATRPPTGLSVRNAIPGKVTQIERDGDHSDLIYIAIGNATVIARITRIATHALELSKDGDVWVLVKAVSMRGHALSP